MKYLKNRKISYSYISLIIFCLFLSACHTGFRRDCNDAKKILSKALSLTKKSNDTVNKTDELSYIEVKINIKESAKYLNNNKKELSSIYHRINNFKNDDKLLHDPLMTTVFINQIVFFYGGFSFEDDIDNIENIMNERDDLELTEWTLDNFFGPIIYKDNIALWERMNYDQKRNSVIDTILTMNKNILKAKSKAGSNSNN